MSLEIIMAPFDVFWAPVDEAAPTNVQDVPAGNWQVLGSTDSLNQNEDGVTVAGSQSFETFRGQSAAPQEVSRTEEDVGVSVWLVDLEPAMLRLALNQNAVSNTGAGGGSGGHDDIELERGAGKPNEIALLIRGPSPQFDGGFAYFYLKRCYNSGSYELQFSKNNPTGIGLEFTALRATSAPFMGRFVSQDSASA